MKRRSERGPAGGAAGDDAPGPVWERLTWFVLLWGSSVLAVAAVSYAIRLVIL